MGNLEYLVGYVHYDLSAWNNTKVRYAVIGVLAAGIPILVCVLSLIAVRCYHARQKKKTPTYDDDDFIKSPFTSSVKGGGDSTVGVKNEYLGKLSDVDPVVIMSASSILK